VLRDLGSLVALDMLINNSDRLPCIWENLGNPGNVMFTSEDNEVVSIDNTVCCIHPGNEQVLQHILGLVGYAAREVARSPGQESSYFARVTNLLRDGCVDGMGWPGLGVDVGTEGTLEVQTGFLNAMEVAVHGKGGEATGLTFQVLQDMKEQLLGPMCETFGVEPAQDVNLYGLEFIHPQYCAAVVDIFREALQQQEDVGRAPAAAAAATPPPALLRMEAPDRRRRTRFESSVVLDEDTQVPMAPSMEQRKSVAIEVIRRAIQLRERTRSAVDWCNTQLMQKAREAKERVRSATEGGAGRASLPLERLACPGPWPEGVDPSRRELWLSEEAFREVFGMEREAFEALPAWKRRLLKRERNLF